MRKRTFTKIVYGVLLGILLICISLKVYSIADNMGWSAEYKKFQITDVYPEQNTIYSLVGYRVVPISFTNYYIDLEDEFWFGTKVKISRASV